MTTQWAVRPRARNHATVRVDARRTYTGEDVARLLRHAVLVLPADEPLILPEGIAIESMTTVRDRRPPSMAAHAEGVEATVGLAMDRGMGREG